MELSEALSCPPGLIPNTGNMSHMGAKLDEEPGNTLSPPALPPRPPPRPRSAVDIGSTSDMGAKRRKTLASSTVTSASYGPSTSSATIPVRSPGLRSVLGQTSPPIHSLSYFSAHRFDGHIKVPLAPKRPKSDHKNAFVKSSCKGKKLKKHHGTESTKFVNPYEKGKTSQNNYAALCKPSTSTETLSEEDWKCGVCSRLFSDDVKIKNGAKWLQCSFCKFPYHEMCQKNPTTSVIFMCDACEPLYGNDDSD